MLRRLALACLLSMATVCAALAQVSQSTVIGTVNSQIGPNGQGLITGQVLQSALDTIISATFQSQGAFGLLLSNPTAAGQIPDASSGTAASWTATPSLGVNGGTGGALTLNGSTSGAVVFSSNATGTNLAISDPITLGVNGVMGGSVTLNGLTSGNASIAAAATAGHVSFTSSSVPSITAGCTGAGSGIVGSDLSGTVTGSTAAATTCTITFGTAFAAAPPCQVTGLNSPLTGAVAIATNTLQVSFASTVNYKFNYFCPGT